MEKVREGISMAPDDIYRNINITDEQAISLGMSLISRLKGASLQIRCMENAIDKGVFLTFNPATSVLEVTSIHKLLHQLITDINTLRTRDMPTTVGN